MLYGYRKKILKICSKDSNQCSRQVQNSTLEGNQASGFAAALNAAGDVNSDSYADLIVGAPEYNVSTSDEGRAYI